MLKVCPTVDRDILWVTGIKPGHRPSLVSELGVESEDVDESRNVETLEITVGERAHVAARLDDERVVAAAEALLLGRGQVLRDVAPDQVSLA